MKQYLIRKNVESKKFQLVKETGNPIDDFIDETIVYEANNFERIILYIAIMNISLDEIDMDYSLTFDEMLLLAKKLDKL